MDELPFPGRRANALSALYYRANRNVFSATIHYNTIKCSSAQSTVTWPTVHCNVSEYM